MERSSPDRVVLAAAIAVAAIALAALLDRPVAMWAQRSGVATWLQVHKPVAEAIKLPGETYVAVVIMLIIAIAHHSRWRGASILLLAILLISSGTLIKWVVGRTRPFKLPMDDNIGEPIAAPFHLTPFAGGFTGIWETRNLCFPSGHAAVSFATATTLAILWPRARWTWIPFAWASVVAVERVVENAHWLSDSVAGAVLGVGGVWLTKRMVTKLSMTEQPEPTDS